MRTKEKTKMIAIRVSDKDLEYFKNNAEKVGKSQTDYFLDLLYKQNIKKINIDTKNLEVELSRQGNNINQIARKLNELGICCKEEIEELKSSFLKILKMQNEIYNKL